VTTAAPRRFEEITPAWLTALLRDSTTLGDARITDINDRADRHRGRIPRPARTAPAAL
jgi:hypothetical protein